MQSNIDRRDLVEQLTADFGVHPGAIFQGFEAPLLNFSIRKKKSKLGDFVEVFGYTFRLMVYAVCGIGSSNFVASIRDDPVALESINEMSQAVTDFKNVIASLNIYGKYAVFLLAVILSPVIALMLLVPLGFAVLRIWKALKKVDEAGGYYCPFFGRRNVLYVNQSKRMLHRYESIVSHEFIHFLQSESLRRLPIDISRLRQEVLYNEILDEEGIGKHGEAIRRHINYLLDLKELEARLHELVLSGYRQLGWLPQTLSEFLQFLSMNADIESSRDILISHLQFDREDKEEENFRLRDKKIGGDVNLLLLALKDIETTLKFIVEVLPVAYCNLMALYGSDISKVSINAEIPRPNLFDRVYGLYYQAE